jgi:tetratricopeptide (TPR) repeat protein
MRAIGLAAILLTAACAARPPVVAPPPAPTVDVDALIRQGCYACLEAAFTAASAAGAGEQTFEAALLLVVRSKELGLPPEPWLQRAAAILARAPEWAVYYNIANALRPDPLSGGGDALATADFARPRAGDAWDTWREGLKTGPASPVVRSYLDLSIACRRDGIGRPALDGASRDAATAAALQASGPVPLLQYRVGLCGGADLEQLDAVRAADEEFVDADLELGRRALQNRVPPDLAEGLKRLRSARTAFATSPVPPMILGNLHETREEWPEALTEYDAALALVTTHLDALLGRTVSLSNLDRYEEALASASELLERGGRSTAQAHYWRAWNLYQLDRIQEARVDADRAKALMVNPALFVLSGMIEWREKRLESSDAEFVKAIEMDFGQCEAAFYLGTVRWERSLWRESLAAFMHAEQCFELSIATRKEAIANLSKTPEEAASNAAMIASHQRAMERSGMRRGQSTQNIASLQKFIGPTAARQ